MISIKGTMDEVKVLVFDKFELGSTPSSSSGIKIPYAYHTSIVVFKKEYTFNCTDGISVQNVENQKKKSYEVKSLGYTRRTQDELEKFIESLKNEWKATNYSLLHKNCQHFCILLCEFLGVEGLPEYVGNLPQLARNYFQTDDDLMLAVGGTTIAVLGLATIGGFILNALK